MRVLIHICCAPCFAYPHKHLRERGHEVVGFWYNPNVHPTLEYRARRDAVERYAELEGVKVLYGEYDLPDYMAMAVAALQEGRRCEACYEYRLKAAFEHARQQGFDAVTTTLLVSHQQKHQTIRDTGERLSGEYGIPFLYEDFREGWDQGRAIATQYGLYRQKYCGCLFSEWERYRNLL